VGSSGSYTDAIDWLWRAGLRFGGVIDLGCADGILSVMLAEQGPTRGAAILNVDAQDDYRDSLAAIQAALGGHYRVCAVGETDGGSIELHRGEHIYWSSVRKADDRYWAAVNGLRVAQPVRVPLRSLDALVAETALPGPYLLKLDIQGAEAAALAGGRVTLARTEAVAVEILVEDFGPIHEALARNDFVLFDLSEFNHGPSGALAWFYAVYVKSRHAMLRPPQQWAAQDNEAILGLQHERREMVQNLIWAALDRYRNGEWAPLPG
jgi:FkbM family methyltransferase